jgi:DNA replication protein DnaC
MEQLKQSLLDIKLKGFADNVDNRIRQALSIRMDYQEFLSLLIEDEKMRRNGKAFQLRLKNSNLRPTKTLDNYKFNLQPSIDVKLIHSLANCDFIKNAEKLIFVGKSGTGKTHCANGLGLKAIAKGYSVIRFNSNDLAEQLLMAKKDKRYVEFTNKILKSDFVIWDEFAIRPYPQGGLEELFALLEKLDENVSMALTSNRDFADWTPFFSDNTIASAFTDRIINKSTIIKVLGDSYRIRTVDKNQDDETIIDNLNS